MTIEFDEDGVVTNYVADEEERIEKPFVRSRYNYDMNKVSDETGLKCEEPTKAQQQFVEECDINTIVERFGITGQLPQDLRMPLQVEFVETMTYHESLNKLIEADAAFMQLPAKVRAEFQNDAGKFVEFVSNEENAERCVELGLAVRKPGKPDPIQVKVVPEEPAQGGA